MTTVATSGSAPILLKFPKDILTNGIKASNFSMLGLGDIIVPGIFLALLLRFDSGEDEEESKQEPKKVPSRIYFYVTLGSYAAGLVLTAGVIHWSRAAQPALLYLVPACVGAPCLFAMIRGEFRELLNYSEEHLVQKKYDENGIESKKKTN